MGNEFPSGHTDTQYRRSSNGAVHAEKDGNSVTEMTDAHARVYLNKRRRQMM